MMNAPLNRRAAEDSAHTDAAKEKGTAPFETAPHNTDDDSNTALAHAATQINAAHTLAMQHAEQAIDHARRVGRLLLEVKQSLPHGEFQTWLDANVAFSKRQAQRYLSAAAGKPLPVRKIAALPKSDTVSYLTLADIPMPRFKAGEYLKAVSVVPDGWYDEIVILPTGNGSAFVAHINGPADGDQMADEGSLITWRKNAVAVEDLPRTLMVLSFPWNCAEIVERRLCDPFDYNVFDEILSRPCTRKALEAQP